MAKRTTTTEIVDDDATERDRETKDELPDDVIRALVELEGADDIRWIISRKSQPNPGYCGELTTSELSLYRIAQDYGPGRYQIRGIKPDGTYYKSATVPIAEPVKKDNSAMFAELMKKSGSSEPSMMPLLMAMMQSSTQITVAALNRANQPPPPKSEFPWAAALSAAPALLLAFKEFTKNNNDTESMDKILKQLTILDKLKGSDKDSSWPDVVRDLASSLPAVFAGRNVPSNPTPVDVTQLPTTPDVDQPAIELPSPTESDPQHMNLLAFLRQQLTALVEAAQRNRNFELQAELLLEELSILPQAIQAQVVGMLQRDDWFDALCAFDARLQPYRGWFDGLRATLFELMHDDDDTSTQEANNDE